MLYYLYLNLLPIKLNNNVFVVGRLNYHYYLKSAFYLFESKSVRVHT